MRSSEPSFGPTLLLSLRLALGTVDLHHRACCCPPRCSCTSSSRRRVRSSSSSPCCRTSCRLIALVAGVAAFFRPNARWFLNSDYSLVPFYVVHGTAVHLPLHRCRHQRNRRANAGRRLTQPWCQLAGDDAQGALPNLTSSILSSAFLTAAVVLGEFTIAGTCRRTRSPCSASTTSAAKAQGGDRVGIVHARRQAPRSSGCSRC